MGAISPVDQVVEVLPDDFCLYPEALLTQMGDDAYHVTDTHWTQQAAMRVTCEVGESIRAGRIGRCRTLVY